jgi:hypothetical protein
MRGALCCSAAAHCRARRRGGAVGQPTQLEDSEPQLTNWLQHKGFDPSSSKLVAQQLPGQGTGLVAQAPIRQGELALAVPESLVLLPQRAAAGMMLLVDHLWQRVPVGALSAVSQH